MLFALVGICQNEVIFASESVIEKPTESELAGSIISVNILDFVTKVELKSVLEISDQEELFVTEDSPEDIIDFISLHLDEYIVVPYSRTQYFYTTNILGQVVQFATISVSGEAYVYSDGKVHLLSMGTSAIAHQQGWTYSIQPRELLNTDGTISYGISNVFFTKSSVEHLFICSVSIAHGNTSPSVSIGQAY